MSMFGDSLLLGVTKFCYQKTRQKGSGEGNDPDLLPKEQLFGLVDTMPLERSHGYSGKH